MRKVLLAGVAVLLAASAPALAGKKQMVLDPGDRADHFHVSFEESRAILERLGYTDIVLVDRNRRDNFNDFDATNPQGQRVRVRSKNTTGDVAFETPLWY